MNKTLATALTVLAMLSSIIFSTAPAFAKAPDKPVYCHGTGSASNPFVEISTSEAALKAHFRDGHQEGEDTFGPCPEATPAPKPSATKPSETKPPVKETSAPTPPAKGTTPATTVPVPPHAEPNPSAPTGAVEAPEQSYPAPVVTPNTVNGVVPESANPTPAPTVPVTPAATATDRLANTGASDNLYIWGAVGLLALIAGIWSVIHARRKA